MSNKDEFELKSALLSTALVQPVDSKSRGKTLEILCRQMPGAEKPWLMVVKEMLKSARSGGFDIHICRRYILKEEELAFGWNIGIETKKTEAMHAAIETLKLVLAEAKPPLVPVTQEQPLGVPASRPAVAGPPAPKLKPKMVVAKPGKNKLAGVQGKKKMLPHPRPAGAPGYYEAPPAGFVPELKTVHESIDRESGREVIIQEMPLPHVFRDLNEPTHPDGRGATYVTEKRKRADR